MPLDTSPEVNLAESQALARKDFAKLLRSGRYTQRRGPDVIESAGGNIFACAIYAWWHNRTGQDYTNDGDAYHAFERATGIPATEIFGRNDTIYSFSAIASYAEAYVPLGASKP